MLLEYLAVALLLALLSTYSEAISIVILNWWDKNQLVSLKKSILETRSLLLKTSAQDEFAKWAKLKRQLEKLQKNYSEMSMAFTLKQQTVSWGIYIVSWMIYTIVIGFHLSTPAFYIKPNVMGVFTSMLNWPYAPVNSVSVFYVVNASCNVFKRMLNLYK
jgi:hypothetical protein